MVEASEPAQALGEGSAQDVALAVVVGNMVAESAADSTAEESAVVTDNMVADSAADSTVEALDAVPGNMVAESAVVQDDMAVD